MTERRTIIIPQGMALMARQIAGLWPGGAGMFTTGLSADGLQPATHYISSGVIDEEIAAALPNAASLLALIQAANPESTATLAQLESLIAACDVSTGDPWARLSVLGLQLITAESE